MADVNAGRGTLGKLVKDEAIYNDARTAIARFNTTAERIDNVVAGAQRGEGTLGKLITDEAALQQRQQPFLGRREAALRLPPEPEEVSDDQIPVVLDQKDCLRGYLKVNLLDAFNHLQGKLR